MGLFSRKNKTDAAKFVEDFYDRYVFVSDPAFDDFAETNAVTTRDLIAEADPSFAGVSLPRLKDELLALRLEMIGTA